MLDAFKLKPFDLEPIYVSWPNAPRFIGNPKKDPPVDDWLQQIKEGCSERNVPKEYWHKVGQYYMGDKAKARLDELKKVMAKVHGGNYRWNWKKFKIAMRNMGWSIDTNATETIKVHKKGSGLWWITRKDDAPVEDTPSTASTSTRPTPQRSGSVLWWTNQKDETPSEETSSAMSEHSRTSSQRSDSSFWLHRRPSMKDEDTKEKDVSENRPGPLRSSSMDLFRPRRGSKDEKEEKDLKRPLPQKAKSDTAVVVSKDKNKPMPPLPVRSETADTVTTVAHAPKWLIEACNALEFLHDEHPKVMSTIGAILITVGSIPAIPAISAGAGGALLASGAAHAVGAIAVAIGTLMKAQEVSTSAQGSATVK